MKFVLAGFALTCSFHVTAAPLAFYVAANGQDHWSGRLATPRADGRDGPFASLSAALKAARQARAQDPAEGITIFMRGGTYELSEPVRLTPEDSGKTATQPLVIAAYQNEKPVLSGGRSISGWKRVANHPALWETEIPAVRAGTSYFRQLFVNGRRAQRARTPNEGYFRIDGPSPQTKPIEFKFQPGQIKPAWTNGEVEMIALLAWADIRMPIRAVDESSNLVTLAGDPRPSNKEKNAQYYIENAPDALDAPGEWYLDRKSGKLRYWAKPGEDMTKAVVVAPRLIELFRLSGDLQARKSAKHIILRGLTLSFTDWDLGPTGYADTQAAVDVRGHLLAEGAIDCRIEDCEFSHLGGYAIELGRGCQRIAIIGNTMMDLAAGGVRLGETAVRQESF